MGTPGSIPFRPLELVINRGIQGSTSAQAIARSLAGRRLDVRVKATPLALRLQVVDDRVLVGAAGRPDDPAADATLEGSALAILGLLRGNSGDAIRDGQVRLTGDADIASEFRELLLMARPDIEEELAKVLGDPLAHQAGVLARRIGDWAIRARRSVGRSVGDYLKEERRSLVGPAEVREFLGEVDALASDVDRADARLMRLRDRFAAK